MPWQNFWIHIYQVSLVEPLVSSSLLTLELSLVHTAHPIYTDTLVPSHAMLYTYMAAAYTQSSCQLATSATPSRHGHRVMISQPLLSYNTCSWVLNRLQARNSTFRESIQHITYVLQYVLPYSANVSRVKSARPWGIRHMLTWR